MLKLKKQEGSVSVRKKIILVITSSIDETASYIITRYSGKANFFRIDVDHFGKYVFSVAETGWKISSSSQTISESQVHAIYYRKPLLPDLQAYEPQYRMMIQRDIIAVINGIVDSFSGMVLTKPSILRKTENKVFQLLYAGKQGFLLPHSYLGNSNAACIHFSQQDSIIKPISTGKTYGAAGWELYQTSMFGNFQDDISITPVYIQDYIPKAYEVRVTMIGDHVYPVRIDSRNRIDWRADYEHHRYTMIKIPTDVVQKCFQLMGDFGLFFGAFDFIVTPNGDWVFLEVNPNGQWLWLEESLNLDISDKIVDFLLQ